MLEFQTVQTVLCMFLPILLLMGGTKLLLIYELNKERAARRKLQEGLIITFREELEWFLRRASDLTPNPGAQVEAGWSNPHFGWGLRLLVETDISKQMEARVEETAKLVALDLGWHFDGLICKHPRGLVTSIKFSR